MKKRSSKKISNKKSSNLLILGLSLVIALGYFLFKTVFSPTPLKIAEIGTSTGTVTLKLESAKTTLQPNETTQVKLTYSVGNSTLTAVQSTILFDPTLVELSSPTTDTSFPTAIISPTITNGQLSFALGVAVNANSGNTGNGQVLTFTLKALKTGTPTLSFSQDTLATTKESTTNALRNVQNLTFNSANQEPSISPSPSASSTTLVSSAPSPTASPSTPAVSSPSPNASVSPSPSNTTAVTKPKTPTNLKYNCYNNGSRITLRWDSTDSVTSYKSVLDQTGDGSDLTSSTTRPETDLDLQANTTYTWRLVSIKDGVNSDPVEVNNIKCNSTDKSSPAATTTPTPSPSPTTTPTPTSKPLTQAITNLFKKSPSPTPRPTSTATPRPSLTPTLASPTPTPSVGNLADIFTTPTPSLNPTPVTSPSLISKIFLGWQALFIKIVESITR